jgi:tRNA-2-methylthio-N6-dimethylallyladenosine synthase
MIGKIFKEPVIEMITSPPTQKYFIKTFGCQMNHYDSDKMADLLKLHFQMEPTESPENADVILLNTCSIREKAQEKVFDALGRLRPFKKKNPNLLIGVAGCVASQEGKNIIQRAPYVDLVFGPQTLHRLPQLIRDRREKHKSQVDISFPEIEKFDHLPTPKAEGIKAYVSIMEGCSKYCSYCVVPYTRGEEVSRPFADVLKECAQLASQGVREITLLGQNVNHYLGPMENGDIADLALLIHYLAEIDGIGIIRFMTSHPVEFGQTLIEAYAHVPKLANHLHLPVQSGSDRILAAMKRGHTALEFKSKIRQLRKVRPDITISTDLIVGFPGETEKDFQDTLKLVEDVYFDLSFCYTYSQRPGTPAAELPDQIPEEVKKERLKILQDKLFAQAQELSRKLIGTVQRILVEGPSYKDPARLSGRTESNRFVHFEGPLDLTGQFVEVKILEAHANSLKAELIS